MKTLSFAGRLILIKHVFSTTPIPISLSIPIPKKTCLLIKKLMRNFLWSAEETKSRSNFGRWNKVFIPKAGGLGIRRVKDVNDACMLKLSWAAIITSSLRASWFSHCYFKNSAKGRFLHLEAD